MAPDWSGVYLGVVVQGQGVVVGSVFRGSENQIGSIRNPGGQKADRAVGTGLVAGI